MIHDTNDVDPDDKVDTKIETTCAVLEDSIRVEIQLIEDREKLSASSLCLPLELLVAPYPPIPLGYALGDQGCVHTIMRGSFKDKLCPQIEEIPVKNDCVVCATSKVEIPVRGKFCANLAANGILLGKNKTIIYVVDNKPNSDIVCDFILGRPSLAESDYHCIDTKTATIFNRKTNKQ